MKPFRITLLLLYATLLAACIDESRDDCLTDRDVVVKFAYVHDGHDVFARNIHGVRLFVFDENGLLRYDETIGSQQLNSFAGTSLSHLEPGNYRVVAWGNATPQRSLFDNTNEGNHIRDACVRRYNLSLSEAEVGFLSEGNVYPGDADPLHYAPYLAQEAFNLTVPLSGHLTVTLPFARAYIDVEVLVLNYERYSGETTAPIIEIDGAASHFDFDRVPFGYITLRETTQIQTQYVERPAVARFRTKLFDDDTHFTKELRVHSAQGNNTVYFTLDNAMVRRLIADFMADNNIRSLKADATPQRVIPITIVFNTDGRGVEVGVKVPEFEKVEGKPWF